MNPNKKEVCPNCNKLCIINEHNNHCPRCGWIFTKYINKYTDDEIKERATTHRTGNGVDMIDG